MNAHAPAPTLTAAAIDNEDVLRHIAARPGGDHLAIAKALGRRSDSVARTLDRLRDDGLVTVSGSPALTEHGARALSALDVAAGRAQVGTGPSDELQLRHDQIVANPNNARKASGLSDASIEEMAETLFRQDMLTPIKVRGPDLTGQHQLVFGERRWRGWGLLIEQGRWAADRLIRCRLFTGSDVDADIEAAVENLQRSDLDNLEAGEDFLRLERDHRMTPQGIAAAIGKPKSLRFIQIAQQVAREATDEAKQQYQASEAAHAAGGKRTFTWTQLRRSVQDHAERPTLDLPPKMAAALGEIALLAKLNDGFAPMARDITCGALVGLTSRELVRFRILDGVRGLELSNTPAIGEWLTQIGFDEDPAAAVERLQANVVGEIVAAMFRRSGEYVTPALNRPDAAPALPDPSPKAAAEDPPAPPPASPSGLADAALRVSRPAGRREPGPMDTTGAEVGAMAERDAQEMAALRGIEPVAPPASFAEQIRQANAEAAAEEALAAMPVPLNPMRQLIVLELAHAIDNGHVRSGSLDAPIYGVRFGPEIWTDKDAQALIGAGLVALLPHAGGEMVVLTDPGAAVLIALGINMALGPGITDLDKARRAAHHPRADGATYSTDWLNVEVLEVITAPGEPAAEVGAGSVAHYPFGHLPFRLTLVLTEAAQIARANGEETRKGEVAELAMAGDEAEAHDLAERLARCGAAVEIEVRDGGGTLLYVFGSES